MVHSDPLTQDGLDPAFYRQKYGDLGELTLEGLRWHWFHHGASEGRLGSAFAVREQFRSLIPRDRLVLEIGPSAAPFMRGPNVRYADVLDTAGLRRRAAAVGYDPSDCPDIHYALADMDLSSIPDTFAGVVGSHSVEHQPDLIGHLNAVERLLEPGGRYYLIVPDKRYCFDHFLPESSIAEVIDARSRLPTRHTLGKVVEHRCLITHNDPPRHWAGDHGPMDPFTRLQWIQEAIAEFEAADGGYVDVHAWQFTPDSFRTLMACLAGLGMIGLQVRAVFDTVRPRNEFCAVLERP